MQTRQTILVLTLFFLLGLFVARLPATVAQLSGGAGGGYEFFDPIIDVYSVIDRAYVDEPDRAKLQIGAINGMLEALGDPYTEFVPPADRAMFQKEITGQFVGIGAEVVTEGGYLTIVSPLEDSPAINAGIRAGDKIIEVNGVSTLNKSVDECIGMLTGEPGTQVTVTVQRTGSEPMEITITRGHIVPRAVRGVHRHVPASAAASAEKAPVWDYMLDPERKIAYIRLTQFTPTAADELAAALKQINADQPGAVGGLILDLRGDPGGVLEGALAVADLFLKEGVIVSVKGRQGPGASGGARDEVYTAKGPGTLPDFPMIVLVNGASASASEIVAGALSDHGRAIVLGTRTFGKGLVQAVQTLRRPMYGGAVGAQLKFTSQRYYLPSGRLIHRTDDATTWGVDPTPGFYVPLTADEQLARILERRARDVLLVTDAAHETTPAVGGDAPRWADPDWIETSLKDKQLALAVRAMHDRIAGGEWKPVSDEIPPEQQPGTITATELRNLELGRERMLRELARIDRRIETLESTLAGDEVAPERTFDLWPDDAPVTGGRIQVYDKDGKLVATLNVTGQNLERWLIDAGVEPVEEQAGGKADAEAESEPAAEPAHQP